MRAELELDLPDFPGKRTFERRVEAFTRLMWGQLHGKPIPMTPQAFNDEHHVAFICTDHPLCVMMQSQQYYEHLSRLHLPDTADNDCPHCGAPPKMRFMGLMSRFDYDEPINVLVIDGVNTRQTTWRGVVNSPFAPAICLACKKEIRDVDTR